MSQAALLAVRVTALVLAVVGIGGMAFGGFLVLEDQASHTDDWDGIGTLLGLVVAVPGLVLVAVTALTWWLAGRDLRAAALLLCILGTVVAALGVLSYAGWGAMLSGALTVAGVLVAGAGLAAAQGADRRADRPSVSSPGGISR